MRRERPERPTRGETPDPGKRVRKPPTPRAWEPKEPPAPFEPERWVDEGPVRDDARQAVARGRQTAPPSQSTQSTTRRRRGPKPVASDVVGAIEKAVGPRRAQRLVTFLSDAAQALADDRLEDAHRNLGPVLREAPDVAEVRELAGQVAYRRGEWKRAVRELEAFRLMRPDDVEALPVLADTYRALGRHGEVDRIWRELREASPRPEVMVEGRIVAAGSLADRGRLDQAISLLERSAARPKRVRDHHLRQWYALADLYDRSGEPVEARRLFARIAEHDRDFFDVAERLAALGR